MIEYLKHKTHIVIHHSLTKDSETVSWGAIRKFHVENQKWNAIGYHFGIEMVNGYPEILLGRMLHETAAAVKEQNMNKKGIHICIVGNFDITEPPKAIWDKAVELTAFLCDMLKIPASTNIKSHNYYAPYKSCPGIKFNMNKFVSDVLTK